MLILASNSPRRKELLSMMGYDFKIVTLNCDENIKKQSPKKTVMKLSELKANSIKDMVSKEDTIIGSDTIVVCRGKVFGKPKSIEESYKMLRFLSNKSHLVYTGVSVLKDGKFYTGYTKNKVKFRKLNDKQIKAYISVESTLDKAGAYGIQGRGATFVKWIKGDYYSIMGLPCCLLNSILNSLGVFPMNN